MKRPAVRSGRRSGGPAASLTGVAAVLSLLVAACAKGPLQLPAGDGEPFADFEQAWADASVECRAVGTLTAEVAVSGRVGGGRVRGRVLVGFERPDRLRIEAVAPAGPPVFILVASGGASTLLMPRTAEVLAGEPAEAVLEALVGVSVRPGELGAILSGCLAPNPVAVAGRRFGSEWLRIDLEDGGTAFLRQAGGRWRIRAGSRPALTVEYDYGPGEPVPSRVGLRTTASAGSGANLQLEPAQVEVGGEIDARAFSLKVPPGAVPITLRDLRAADPLGARLR